MKKMYCIVLCIFLFYCIGYGQNEYKQKKKRTDFKLKFFTGIPEFINIEMDGFFDVFRNRIDDDSYGIKKTLYSNINTGYDGNLMHYRGVVGYCYSPVPGFITSHLV